MKDQSAQAPLLHCVASHIKHDSHIFYSIRTSAIFRGCEMTAYWQDDFCLHTLAKNLEKGEVCLSLVASSEDLPQEQDKTIFH